MNLMPVTPGTLRLGDPVTVLERRTPLVFGPFAGVPRATEAPWPAGPTLLRCLSVSPEAPGVLTFAFERQDGQPVRWEAGQHLTLKVDLPDGPARRSFTLSSSHRLQITVKRLEGGRVSAWLHDRLVPGTLVACEDLGGRFTLADHPWPSYLFLGAGTGMTPLVAMVERLADENLAVAVALHQSARTRGDVLFRRRLLTLQEKLGDRLVLGTRITSEEGRLDHQGLVKFCPDLRDRRVFACGPVGYRTDVRGLLAGAGLKVDFRFHEEAFAADPPAPPVNAVPGTVTFRRSGKTVASDGRTTVLQLAEGAGVAVASSCRTGECGACRLQKANGEWVLACQNYPEGDQEYRG